MTFTLESTCKQVNNWGSICSVLYVVKVYITYNPKDYWWCHSYSLYTANNIMYAQLKLRRRKMWREKQTKRLFSAVRNSMEHESWGSTVLVKTIFQHCFAFPHEKKRQQGTSLFWPIISPLVWSLKLSLTFRLFQEYCHKEFSMTFTDLTFLCTHQNLNEFIHQRLSEDLWETFLY